MKQVLQIPTDVGEYLRGAAKVLDGEKANLDQLYEIFKDEDPDPENGWFWSISLDRKETDRLRENLKRVIEILNWLADHGNHGGPVERTEASHDGA